MRNKINNDLFLSFIYSFIPILGFFSVYNLRQMNDNEIYYFILINLIFTFLILTLAKIFKEILSFFKIKIYYIYQFSIIIYVFLFNFLEFKSFFTFVDIEHRTEVIAILIFILCIIILYFMSKYKVFAGLISRFIFIYFIIFFSISIFGFTKHFIFFNENKISNNKKLNENLYQDKKNNSKAINENAYYIIFDMMTSLDAAYEQNIINNRDNILMEYKENNLHYINNSISNYNSTTLSLASIFNLSSKNTILPNDGTYKNNKKFYPNMLYSKKTNLAKILDENNYKLYWLGNEHYHCRSILQYNIHCFKGELFSYLISLNRTYFHTHLFIVLLNKIANFKSNGEPVSFKFANNSEPFINEIKNVEKNNKYFLFAHLLLPHPPFIFNEKCDLKKIFTNEGMIDESLNIMDKENFQIGYKYNYVCSLKIIEKLIFSIKKIDPNSIIVIQGDHGAIFNANGESGFFYYYVDQVKDEATIKKYKKSMFDRAQIFNLIADDGRCSEKNKANTNSNTAVFVLNCLLGLNLKYEEKVHYMSNGFANGNLGKVLKGF